MNHSLSKKPVVKIKFFVVVILQNEAFHNFYLRISTWSVVIVFQIELSTTFCMAELVCSKL